MYSNWLRNFGSIILLVVGIWGCQQTSYISSTPPLTANVSRDFTIDQVSLNRTDEAFTDTLWLEQTEAGTYLLNYRVDALQLNAGTPRFDLSIRFPKTVIEKLWNSRTWSGKSLFQTEAYSRAGADFDLIAAITKQDRNIVTIAAIDQLKQVALETVVREREEFLEITFKGFEKTSLVSPVDHYTLQVMIDLRANSYVEAIQDAGSWKMERDTAYQVVMPDEMVMPVYATWYPMFLNIPIEDLQREADSISSAGFRSVLFDEGWQYQLQFPLDTIGQWEPDRIPSVNNYLLKLRALDLKIFGIYSNCFIGGNRNALNYFKGKYLPYKNSANLYVLDPRYADTREYLSEFFQRMQDVWPLDGFVFDFLNDFYPNDALIQTNNFGRDFMDVVDATNCFYNTLEADLTAIDSSFVLSRGNKMLGPRNRVGFQNRTGFIDLKKASVVRERIVNNRLIYGMQSPAREIVALRESDRPSEVAMKLQQVLFAPLYISTFFTTMTPEARNTLDFWVEYWKLNQQVLISGHFLPHLSSGTYPLISASHDEKAIVVLYDEMEAVLGNEAVRVTDIINARANEQLILRTASEHSAYQMEVFNHCGLLISGPTAVRARKSQIHVRVPAGGFVRLSAIPEPE